MHRKHQKVSLAVTGQTCVTSKSRHLQTVGQKVSISELPTAVNAGESDCGSAGSHEQ